MSDQLASDRRLRILNVDDDFPRLCVGQLVATSITGARLALFLAGPGKAAAHPKAVVCDNGPELTSKAMRFWSERSGAALNFIQPGKPTQNAFVESFNGKFRDSCLNQHWFRGLADVRRIVDDWHHHCDHERPHSSLSYPTPAERAKQAVPFYSFSKWTCLRGRVNDMETVAQIPAPLSGPCELWPTYVLWPSSSSGAGALSGRRRSASRGRRAAHARPGGMGRHCPTLRSCADSRRARLG